MMDKNVVKSEKAACHPSVLLEHNVFIVWRPEYDLGIMILDDQHRGIVSIINSYFFGTKCDSIKNLSQPTIAMLASYARIHFQTEEYFLEAINYPGLNSHRALHHAYTSKLAEIERLSKLDKDPYILMNFLKAWWLDHICGADMDFKSFFL